MKEIMVDCMSVDCDLQISPLNENFENEEIERDNYRKYSSKCCKENFRIFLQIVVSKGRTFNFLESKFFEDKQLQDFL